MHFDPLLLCKALLTGFVAGVAFSLLKLPIPAPSELASIVGVIGVFLGFLAVRAFVH
jgi:XapX domain-containing protein